MTLTRLLQERPWTVAWVVIEVCLIGRAVADLWWP